MRAKYLSAHRFLCLRGVRKGRNLEISALFYGAMWASKPLFIRLCDGAIGASNRLNTAFDPSIATGTCSVFGYRSCAGRIKGGEALGLGSVR